MSPRRILVLPLSDGEPILKVLGECEKLSRICESRFILTDEGPVEICFFGELVLREAAFASNSGDVAAKRDKGAVPVGHRCYHAHNDAGPSVDYRLHSERQVIGNR